MLHGRHPVQAGPLQIRDPEPRRERERVPLVALAPAEDRCVGREAEGLVACLHRAGDEFLRHGAVPVDVQLEPPRSVGRRGDFLQGFRRDRACDENRFRGGGAPGGRDFALGMDEGVERRGSHADRHRHALSEEDGLGVAFRYVGQDAGPQRPSPKGFAVPSEGDFILGPARDVIECRARDLRPRHVLEFEEIRELEAHVGRDGLPPLIRCSAVNQTIGIAGIYSRYDGCSAFLRSRFWRQTATWYRSDERRFMYRSKSGFSVSCLERETTRRSARRATVRAQWSRARDSEPRGRMNSVILPTSKASIASSSRATWTAVICGTLVPSDDRVIASSAPTVKRSSWIFDSRSRMRRSRCAAMARPMTALSSSTVPIASTRGSSFETRSGPRRPVSPASPRRVYSFAITSPAPPHLGEAPSGRDLAAGCGRESPGRPRAAARGG